jgi:PST family polysaccharide transporter
MAFFGLYVWHSLLIYWIVRRLSGFRLSAANRKLNLIILPLIGLVFWGFYVLPFWLATTAGALAALGSGIYSLRTLLKLVSVVRLPLRVRKVLALIGIAPPCEEG